MNAPEPKTEEFNLLGRDDAPLRIRGQLLGLATSRRDIHTHDDVLARDEDIVKEIAKWEDRLDTLTKRHDEATTAHCKTAIEKYLDELDAAEYPTRYADQGDRCSACRWFEVRIFRVVAELDGDGESPPSGQYLLLTYGLSDVPGEVAKRRAQFTNSPYVVLENLTQRRGHQAFLPATSARVLAEAAAVDDGIANAYVNRAVA